MATLRTPMRRQTSPVQCGDVASTLSNGLETSVGWMTDANELRIAFFVSMVVTQLKPTKDTARDRGQDKKQENNIAPQADYLLSPACFSPRSSREQDIVYGRLSVRPPRRVLGGKAGRVTMAWPPRQADRQPPSPPPNSFSAGCAYGLSIIESPFGVQRYRHASMKCISRLDSSAARELSRQVSNNRTKEKQKLLTTRPFPQGTAVISTSVYKEEGRA